MATLGESACLLASYSTKGMCYTVKKYVFCVRDDERYEIMEVTNDEQKISQALGWIVSLLNRHSIPYQIVGGLAAKAYDAKRPLIDIDLYAPLDMAHAALEEMRPYITRDPLPHLSASWDLIYMALEYHGMLIEIGDSSSHPRFYNRKDQCWELQCIDFTCSTHLKLYTSEVTVMPKDELLSYKMQLDREVDHLDIQQITEASC